MSEKLTEKHAGGRPRKYQTVAEMQAAIDAYVDETQIGEMTVTGLALSLGFASRQALMNYEGYSEEFHDAIKRAKLRVENDYEKSLRKRGSAGEIFGLKNFGWSDKQEIEQTSESRVKFIVEYDADSDEAEDPTA